MIYILKKDNKSVKITFKLTIQHEQYTFIKQKRKSSAANCNVKNCVCVYVSVSSNPVGTKKTEKQTRNKVAKIRNMVLLINIRVY